MRSLVFFSAWLLFCFPAAAQQIDTVYIDSAQVVTRVTSVHDFFPPEPPEEMPGFPGGDIALRKFIREHLCLPVLDSTEGTVKAKFSIEADGSVGEVSILKSPSDEASRNVQEMVRQMPKWKPARSKGRQVRSTWFLPVRILYE